MSAEGVGARAAFDAVILAGGRGSRLGGVDKAAIEVDGARLLDRVVAASRRAGAERVVVVGPDRAPAPAGPASASPGPDAVLRENPPFGGPLPALAAGLAEVRAEWVMLLPCDLARPDLLCARLRSAWQEAVASAGGDARDGDAREGDARDGDARDGDARDEDARDGEFRDGLRLIDGDGRPQWLAGVYRADALRRGIATAVDAAGDPAPRNRTDPAPAASSGAALANLPLRLAFAKARIAEVLVPDDVLADIDTPEDLARARASGRDAKSDGPPRHPS